MENLVANMEQKTATYIINPNHFLVDIFIAHNKKVVIIAQKDNNFTEWLSIGRLSNTDNHIGECVSYILGHSPLSTSTHLWWENYEEATKNKYDELFVLYLKLRIITVDGLHFIMNGERMARDVSAEYIQQRLIEYYRNNIEASPIVDDKSFVRDQLQNALYEIRTMEQEYPFPWALDHVSTHADKIFKNLKNKYLFCQDKEIKMLLYELYQLKTSLYNKYMSAVR